MIVIKNIEVIETTRDEYEIHMAKLNTKEKPFGESAKYINVTKEMIYGKEFININGERVCIGMSKQVQRQLGCHLKLLIICQKTSTIKL